MNIRLTKVLVLMTALTAATAGWAGSTVLPLPFPTDKESRAISVVVDRGLRRTVDLPSKALRDARIAMLDGETLEPDVLRQLAERRDTLAALRYVDVLMEDGLEENASDIAYFASIAVGGGRIWAMPELVTALALLDPATEPKARVNQYIKVLYPHAWAGNTLALDAVIDFNGEGRLFGALSASTKAKIEQQVESSDTGRGNLKLAIAILRKETITDEDLGQALVYLRRAEQADHLAVATTAANLIEQITTRRVTAPVVTN